MTDAVTGPFNGLFKNLENMRLAEIWITEAGPDYEFGRDEFVRGTGINPNSSSRVLNMLTEKGIITCYPSPKDSHKLLYRVAWPVTVVKSAAPKSTINPDIAQVTYAEGSPIDVYHVRLFFGKEELTQVTVEADSPDEAARLAREKIKARVSLEWEF